MTPVLGFLVALLGVALGSPQRTLVPILGGRIVGGQDASIEDHPWQVSLLRSGSHICGAAIISANWVTTVAHCVTNSPSLFSIRAGSSYHNSGGTVYQVASLVIHPQYNSRTSDYDIAVLSVITPIVFGSGVQSIPLAPAGSGPVAGATSIFTGWGLTVEGGSASNVLQEVSLPIISQADCRAAYSVSSITDRMFCAGLLEEGGKDACHGDSGGPVVVGRLLTGLISWGNGCARPNTPAVNTNIPSMRQWILDTTGI